MGAGKPKLAGHGLLLDGPTAWVDAAVDLVAEDTVAIYGLNLRHPIILMTDL